jgi:aspartate/methionine/tyrosine aminotransferase
MGLESDRSIFDFVDDNLLFRVTSYLLENHFRITSEQSQEFSERKKLLMDRLLNLGWRVKSPKATPFFWIQIPPHYSSLGFARMLLRKTGVAVIPGSDFGESGEGYIRLALNLPGDKLKEATKRIERHSHLLQFSYRPKRRR